MLSGGGSVFLRSQYYRIRTTCAGRAAALTSGLVVISERLQDAVHSPHVEQEAKLRDAHGHQAEQEGRGGDGF